jgi:outer membrane cobalamin receptor
MRSVPHGATTARSAGVACIARFVCIAAALSIVFTLRVAGLADDPKSPAPDSLTLARRLGEIAHCPLAIDTIYVYAKRPTRGEILARRSAFTTFIPVAQARGPAEGIAALLARAAGVQVQRYGGPGATATVSIRGADPGQVEVFLDRTPLRSASRSVVDLNALDLAQIEAVEVYRSFPPTDLGGAAGGAAIRLITPATTSGRVHLRYAAGSYGTRDADGLASGTLNARSRYLLSFSRFSTRGDFRYRDDNGTEQEPGDDIQARWSNGDVRRLTLLGKFTFDLPARQTLEWSGLYTERAQGVPGSNGRPTRTVRLQTASRLQRIEYANAGGLHPALQTQLYAFREGRDQLFSDPQRELNLLGSPRRVEQDETRRGAGLHLRATHASPRRLLGAHGVELLAEVTREGLSQAPPAGRPAEDRRRRNSRLLSVGDHWELLYGGLELSAFYRWERAQDNYTGADPYRPFTPQAAHRATAAGPRLGLRVSAGGGHTFKANAARQNRFPSFAELFGSEGLVRGNAGLRAETGVCADLGWCWSRETGTRGTRLRAEQVFYQNDLEQMIVFIMVSNRETKPYNLDAARIRGSETELSIGNPPLLRDLGRLLPGADSLGIELSLRATIQDARDLGVSPVYHGKQLTYHPPAQGEARCDLGWRGWQLDYAAHYRAGSYWSRSNLPAFKSDDQWSHDLRLRYRLGDSGVAAALRIENLTAARLEDVRGYPLPGRAWFAEIEWLAQEGK